MGAGDVPLATAEPLVTGTTDGQGLLALGELGPGDYCLLETRAPAGYNRTTSPIRVQVTAAGVTAMQENNTAQVTKKGDAH